MDVEEEVINSTWAGWSDGLGGKVSTVKDL